MAEKAEMGETVSLPPTYAPSETYTESPPPAYKRSESVTLKITRLVCITVLALSLLIGVFVLLSNWMSNNGAVNEAASQEDISKLALFGPEKLVSLQGDEMVGNVKESSNVVEEFTPDDPQKETEVKGEQSPLLPDESFPELMVGEQNPNAREQEEDLNTIEQKPNNVRCRVSKRQKEIGLGIMTQAIIVACDDDETNENTDKVDPLPVPSPKGPLSILAPLLKMLTSPLSTRIPPPRLIASNEEQRPNFPDGLVPLARMPFPRPFAPPMGVPEGPMMFSPVPVPPPGMHIDGPFMPVPVQRVAVPVPVAMRAVAVPFQMPFNSQPQGPVMFEGPFPIEGPFPLDGPMSFTQPQHTNIPFSQGDDMPSGRLIGPFPLPPMREALNQRGVFRIAPQNVINAPDQRLLPMRGPLAQPSSPLEPVAAFPASSEPLPLPVAAPASPVMQSNENREFADNSEPVRIHNPFIFSPQSEERPPMPIPISGPPVHILDRNEEENSMSLIKPIIKHIRVISPTPNEHQEEASENEANPEDKPDIPFPLGPLIKLFPPTMTRIIRIRPATSVDMNNEQFESPVSSGLPFPRGALPLEPRPEFPHQETNEEPDPNELPVASARALPFPVAIPGLKLIRLPLNPHQGVTRMEVREIPEPLQLPQDVPEDTLLSQDSSETDSNTLTQPISFLQGVPFGEVFDHKESEFGPPRQETLIREPLDLLAQAHELQQHRLENVQTDFMTPPAAFESQGRSGLLKEFRPSPETLELNEHHHLIIN